MKLRLGWLGVLTAGLACLAVHGAVAATVGRIQVHIITGAEELTAGSLVELRIYEAGRGPRHFTLTHGASWPRDSTLTIPLTLSEPLDPHNVVRFSLYYRAASPLAPAWDVVSADVDLAPGRSPDLLLNTTLSGAITREGELGTDEREASASMCRTDGDCDDHKKCDGHERCAPHEAGADSRGCVKGMPLVCPVNQVCGEAHGCRGIDTGANAK